MQTALRLDDDIFREAKAEAARLGMTLTRFIEDALRQKLARTVPRRVKLPVYDSGVRLPLDFDLVAAAAEEEGAYADREAEKAIRPKKRSPKQPPPAK